jgi:uncharacterized membrane protein
MYEVPQESKPGCRDVWVISLAVFAVILPIVGVMLALLGAITATFVLFTIHPALALIPIGLSAAGIGAFVLWERNRFKPPGL